MKEKKYKINERALISTIIINNMSTDSMDEFAGKASYLENSEVKKLAKIDLLFMKMVAICFKDKPFTLNELRTDLIDFWYKHEVNNYPEGYSEKFVKYLGLSIDRGLELGNFIEQEDA